MEKDPNSRVLSPSQETTSCGNQGSAVHEICAPSLMQGGYEKLCRHIERGINLDKLSSQLFKSKLSLSQCEDCVNDIKAGIGKESKGRSSQKKAARLTDAALNSNSYHQEEKWVCLACGHVACGTLLDNLIVDGKAQSFTHDEIRAPTSGHAWKHSVFARHPLAMQAGDNLVSWCFMCNMPVDYPMPLNTHDNSQLVTGRNPLQDAADIVRERLSKKRGFLKDSAKMCYTIEPVRCVIDTVRCVIDSATHVKASDAANTNVSVSIPCIGSGKKRSVKGLMNLGNTCFFNSVMQNLLALDVLQDHFRQEPRDNEGPLTSSLRYLYQEVNSEHVPMTSLNSYSFEYGLKRSWRGPAMWGSSEKVCNPCSLFDAICAKAPRFRGFQQQDSHELLRYLLEGLNSEERGAKSLLNGDFKKSLSTSLSKVLGQNGHDTDLESGEEDREQGNTKKVHSPQVIPTFVESIFGGQLSSTVHCCECGHLSVVHETMLDLSLQIPTRQIVKKRQAHENQGVLSLYEDSKLSERAPMMGTREPAPMMGTPETTPASASVPKESKECFLEPFSSPQAEWMNPLWPEVAESSKVTFDDNFSIPKFASLHSDGGGMHSEEGFLQNSFDIPYHADNHEYTLFAGVGDCIPGDALKAELDPLTHEENRNLHGIKEVDMQWHMDSASADGVLSEILQNEKICVESSSTNACEVLQDEDVLTQSKDDCSTTGITLPLYTHSEVANNCREEEVANNCREEELPQITCVPAECNHDKSSYVEGKRSNSLLETKEAYGASPQPLEGAETLSYINQEMEASKGHLEGNEDTEETSIKFMWAADSAAFDKAKVAIGPEQVINCEDDVLPLSLEACLADFTKLELLCGDNAWECENCSRLAKGKENTLAQDNTVKTREGHLSTEVMDSKDLSENLLERKDEKDIWAFSNGSSCNSKQSKVSALNHVEDNGIYQALQNADISTRASSEITEGGSPSFGIMDHNVEQTYSGCANLAAVGGVQQNGGDCFTFEVDNKHGNITHTLDDMSKGDQKNKVGTGVLNNQDKIGGAQSSLAGKSVTPHPLFKKHLQPEGYGFGHTCSKMLPNLRKEKLFFFSGFFSKTENHKAKIEQQQNLAKTDATKKYLISKPPLILTVHLKRFAQDARGRFNKLCGHVAFSEFLDLRPYLDPRCLDHDNCLYRLMGIVEHGGTMRGGHYVAYVRGPCVEESTDSIDHDKDSWYCISDSRIYKSTIQDVLGREAYLLFYERCNAKEQSNDVADLQ